MVPSTTVSISLILCHPSHPSPSYHVPTIVSNHPQLTGPDHSILLRFNTPPSQTPYSPFPGATQLARACAFITTRRHYTVHGVQNGNSGVLPLTNPIRSAPLVKKTGIKITVICA